MRLECGVRTVVTGSGQWSEGKDSGQWIRTNVNGSGQGSMGQDSGQDKCE